MTTLARALESVGAHVAEAAKRAWELHGEPVRMSSLPVNGHAQLPSVAAMKARRVEYVVESDAADVWDTLAGLDLAEDSQRCALVPLRLMGTAHERLCDHDFELQGWWLEDEGARVVFGGVEIA